MCAGLWKVSDDNEDEERSQRRADMIERSALLEDTLLLHILKPVLHAFCCSKTSASPFSEDVQA